MSHRLAIVWGQPNCIWCDRAKRLLYSFDYGVEYKEIGNGYTKKDLLAEVPTARSVPQVIIDGIVIGGYNELSEFFRNA